VEDHQSFFDEEPDQPTAKGALAIKCCDMLSGPVETIVYSNSRFIRVAKHALCDEMEQAAISWSPNAKRHYPVFCRTFRDRNALI
jgi:hypothetical protein